jgi:hypothetical protein
MGAKVDLSKQMQKRCRTRSKALEIPIVAAAAIRRGILPYQQGKLVKMP